jgi:hypothetical protein
MNGKSRGTGVGIDDTGFYKIYTMSGAATRRNWEIKTAGAIGPVENYGECDGGCGLEILTTSHDRAYRHLLEGWPEEDLTFGDSQHRECAADGH